MPPTGQGWNPFRAKTRPREPKITRRSPPGRLTDQSTEPIVVLASSSVQPLAGLLVADFSRYTPGPFATRELLRLGARVVRVEPPEGDPLRAFAPGWDDAINAGKESVLCDLKEEAGLALAQALVDPADVVVDGFRPGVLERVGLRFPESAVVCSII